MVKPTGRLFIFVHIFQNLEEKDKKHQVTKDQLVKEKKHLQERLIQLQDKLQDNYGHKRRSISECSSGVSSNSSNSEPEMSETVDMFDSTDSGQLICLLDDCCRSPFVSLFSCSHTPLICQFQDAVRPGSECQMVVGWATTSHGGLPLGLLPSNCSLDSHMFSQQNANENFWPVLAHLSGVHWFWLMSCVWLLINMFQC